MSHLEVPCDSPWLAVDLAPFDEVGVCRLLAMLDRVGDRAGAARAYQEFTDRLAAELELTPSPETEAHQGDQIAYWQSKISSILGDQQRALTLMTDVWGQQGVYGVHAEFDYERMWSAREFRRSISPKG